MSPILGSLHIFASAYSDSDFFGKLIFLGLFALSAICWVVLIQKIITVRKVRQLSTTFQRTFQKNKEQLLGIERTHLPLNAPNPYAEVFFALKDKTLEVMNKNMYFAKQTEQADKGVHLSKEDLELIESHALTAISIQEKQQEKNLFILSTIVTLAPFLGLLGTVWGILITFAELHQGSSASSNSVILGGLSTALATTVLGLVIAIPALIAYNYLKSSSKKLSSDMEDFVADLMSTIELQYRRTN